jgi:hypothetical protein
VTAYSPVFTTLLRYPIDSLAAEELVAAIAGARLITPAVVVALTTPGNVFAIAVVNEDGVVALIPVRPVPFSRIFRGINSVVTTEGLDRVAPAALVEEFGVLGTHDLGRISTNGE